MNLQELNQKELNEISAGGLFDGVEWWEGSGSNPVVGAANAAYNAGVIAGNAAEPAINAITAGWNAIFG